MRLAEQGAKWRRTNVTPSSLSRLSVLALCVTATMSMAAQAETFQPVGRHQADGWFTTAQTNGMHRRDDRRGTRQDCRQTEGVAGGDKRNCKQQGRQNRTG